MRPDTISTRSLGLLAVAVTAFGMLLVSNTVIAKPPKGKPGGGGGGETLLPTYSVIRLGTLGGTDSIAGAINGIGQVVGQASTANGETHAFIWDPVNGMSDLGTLGGPSSGAGDINSGGDIVGVSTTALGDQHGVLWRNGQAIDLGTLGGLTTCACAINDSTCIAGWSTNAPDGRAHAFVLIPSDTDSDGQPDIWNRDDNNDGINDLMIDLGELPGGPTSVAYDLNNQLEVVGMSEDADFRSRPVVWDGLGPLALSSLSSTGFGYAKAINNAGQIGGDTPDSQNNPHLVIWTPTAGGGYELSDLGTMKNATSLICQGISDPDAQQNVFVTGYWSVSRRVKGRSVTEFSPFAWTTGDESLTDLNSLISNTDGFDRLISAHGLNDSGIIVGKGEFGNANRAFIAVPNP